MHLVIADAHHLPFRKGVFDFVLVINTLEFVQYPVAALAEGMRVGNGHAVVGVLNKWSISSCWRRLKSLCCDSPFRRAVFYSPMDLKGLIRAAGGPYIRYIWGTTLVSFPVVPMRLQPFLARLDRWLQRHACPFGAFLAARIEWDPEVISYS